MSGGEAQRVKLAKELGAFPDFVYSMYNTFWHHRNVKVAQGGFHRFSKQFSDNDRLTPKEIFRQLKKGATVFFNGVQHWSPSVAGLNLQLARTFSHLANINMYVTAGGVSKSMSAHNDIQCTFVFPLISGVALRIQCKLTCRPTRPFPN